MAPPPFATIGNLIKDEVNSMQAFFNSYIMSRVAFNKAEKAKKRQDLMDGLLRSAYYPFVSGKKRIDLLPCSNGEPYNLSFLLNFLPQGEEDSVSLVIGQLGGWPVSVKIWGEGYQSFSSYYTYYNLVVSKSVEITGQEEMTYTIRG